MRAISIVVSLALASLAACSSGDDRLSKREYEQRVMEIYAGPGGKADRLFFAVVADDPALPAAACTAQARQLRNTLERIVAEVEELRPPAEVERLHEQFLAAANDSVDAVGRAVDDVEDRELKCGQALNHRIYGLRSTDRAERVIERFHERGYLRFLLGE